MANEMDTVIRVILDARRVLPCLRFTYRVSHPLSLAPPFSHFPPPQVCAPRPVLGHRALPLPHRRHRQLRLHDAAGRVLHPGRRTAQGRFTSSRQVYCSR